MRWDEETYGLLENKSGYKIIAHYLDDSLFGGEKDSDECEKWMYLFDENCCEFVFSLAIK